MPRNTSSSVSTNCMGFVSIPGRQPFSKVDSRGQLHFARTVGLRADHSEIRGIDIGSDPGELHSIGDVEEVALNRQPGPLADAEFPPDAQVLVGVERIAEIVG